MTKRFKINPDNTCPELAGYKLPPCSRGQEDGVEAIVKNLMGLPDYLNLESMSPSMKGSFDFGVQCYTKAREKYEFSREDMAKVIEYMIKNPISAELRTELEIDFNKGVSVLSKYFERILTPRNPIAIEVEMDSTKSLLGVWTGFVPALNPDGTVKGRWVYE